MPEYRRWYVAGGTYFFTLVTERRAAILTDDRARRVLHEVIADVRAARPFDLFAMVLLPDHLHMIWTLPDDDADFRTRLASIKSNFTRGYLDAGGDEQSVSASRREHGGRGVWQRRYWEHVIRDADDLERHVEYTHYNPVKHGYARCPHEWPWSSFHRFVREGTYPREWGCSCDGDATSLADFGWADGLE